MTETVKRIIEWNIDLIDKNQWDDFFHYIQDRYDSMTVRSVADTLFRANIEPLSQMTFIPSGFYMLSKAIKIDIPASIKRICFKAFGGASIRSITIPRNVLEIEEYAFHYCDLLTTLLIQEGVRYLENGSFSHCSNLKSVHLPKSLSHIGSAVFQDCSVLTEVHYAGSISDWKQIINHELINESAYIRKVICLDGIIEL